MTNILHTARIEMSMLMLLCNDESEDGKILSLVIKVKDDVFLSVTQTYSDKVFFSFRSKCSVKT